MSELWRYLIPVLTFLATVGVQVIGYLKVRGEFISVMKNFPPHKHINGTIIYSVEYPNQPAEKSQVH